MTFLTWTKYQISWNCSCLCYKMQLMPSGSSIFQKHSHRLCESWAMSVSFCDKRIIHYCFISEDSLRQATENTRSLPIATSKLHRMIQRVSEDERRLGVTGLTQMRMRTLEKVLEGGTAPQPYLEPTWEWFFSSFLPYPPSPATTTNSVVLNRGPSIVGGGVTGSD